MRFSATSLTAAAALLALASGLGGFASSVTALLVLRAIEGLGFLLVALPAPALIRRLVPPAQLPGVLGVRVKIAKLEIFGDCEVAIRMETGQW